MGLLADYAVQLRRIADALDAMNAVPAPVVVPPTFDEAWYLRTYPDVAAAIPAYFSSGWDHYDRCGRAEGRLPGPWATPAPPPVPVPLPAPPPAPAPVWEPLGSYPSAAALRDALAAHRDYAYVVSLDGKDAFGDGQSRFGPATQFHSWPDGTVRQEALRPEVVVPSLRPRGSALLNSYPNPAALIKDAQDVGWTWAVLLDDEPLLGGFEATPPAVYVRRDGKVVRA